MSTYSPCHKNINQNKPLFLFMENYLLLTIMEMMDSLTLFCGCEQSWFGEFWVLEKNEKAASLTAKELILLIFVSLHLEYCRNSVYETLLCMKTQKMMIQ